LSIGNADCRLAMPIVNQQMTIANRQFRTQSTIANPQS